MFVYNYFTSHMQKLRNKQTLAKLIIFISKITKKVVHSPR